MKHLTTKWNTVIFADIDVYKADESVDSTPVNKDDIITLGYVENESVQDYTGRVDGFIPNLKKTPSTAYTANPVDTIKEDIEITGVVLDCSKQYASNVVKLNAIDIVEASDTTDVVKVMVTPNIKASVTVISMSDEGEKSEETLEDIMVGKEISTISFKLANGKKKVVAGTVKKFLYKEDAEKIVIYAFILKDDKGNVWNIAFKDIVCLNEEIPLEEESNEDEPGDEEQQEGNITPPSGPTEEENF